MIPESIRSQLEEAVSLLTQHLGSKIETLHLFGSAVDGGLQPNSDIDLLVTVAGSLPESVRNSLMQQLLTISAPPRTDTKLRALEVTVIAKEAITPWRHPARRELQFGEWLRPDLEAGIYEQPTLDHDLAILLRKVHLHSVRLVGSDDVLPLIPDVDFLGALHDTLDLWHCEDDIRGDEWHIVLSLARIWFSITTGEIVPKDVAAEWALERAPAEHQPILEAALSTYLGASVDSWPQRIPEVLSFVSFVRTTTARVKQ